MSGTEALREREDIVFCGVSVYCLYFYLYARAVGLHFLCARQVACIRHLLKDSLRLMLPALQLIAHLALLLRLVLLARRTVIWATDYHAPFLVLPLLGRQ